MGLGRHADAERDPPVSAPRAIEGVWWRADRPQEQLAGRLEITPEEISLRVFGSFAEGGLPNMTKVAGEYPLVYGVGEGLWVTLRGCVESELNVTMPGTLRSTLLAPGAHLGAHLRSFVVTKARVAFGYLADWAEPPAVSLDRVGEGSDESFRLTVPAAKRTAAQLDEATISPQNPGHADR